MPKILTWENGQKVIREMTEAEIESTKPTADQVRAERDSLLAQSDFRMVPDAPWDRDAWATYRQALRDITEQAGFPQDVAWPEKP